jgi:hypothetical protein
VTVSALTYKSPSTFPRRPVILLDVDGVINMWTGNCGWTDAVSTEVYGYSIQHSPTMIKKINEWNSIAEVRWLTTWESKAQSLLAPALGLDKFALRHKDTPNNPNNACIDKTEAAINTAEEVGIDGLVIWIDGDLEMWKPFHDKEI